MKKLKEKRFGKKCGVKNEDHSPFSFFYPAFFTKPSSVLIFSIVLTARNLNDCSQQMNTIGVVPCSGSGDSKFNSRREADFALAQVIHWRELNFEPPDPWPATESDAPSSDWAGNSGSAKPATRLGVPWAINCYPVAVPLRCGSVCRYLRENCFEDDDRGDSD